MYEIREYNTNYLHESFRDEDRYVIVDEEGYDVDGIHYSLQDAEERLNELNNK